MIAAGATSPLAGARLRVGDVISVASRTGAALAHVRPITDQGKELVAQVLSAFRSASAEELARTGASALDVLRVGNLDAVRGVSPQQREMINRLQPNDLAMLRDAALRLGDSIQMATGRRICITAEQLYRIAEAAGERARDSYVTVRASTDSAVTFARQWASAAGQYFSQAISMVRRSNPTIVGGTAAGAAATERHSFRAQSRLSVLHLPKLGHMVQPQLLVFLLDLRFIFPELGDIPEPTGSGKESAICFISSLRHHPDIPHY
ncbi:MAG: hypothetical protein HY465_04145 [Deltaproteobacteria bacterium]|nr:hypothetical protein [Deltaproteobacteria bacterium]